MPASRLPMPQPGRPGFGFALSRGRTNSDIARISTCFYLNCIYGVSGFRVGSHLQFPIRLARALTPQLHQLPELGLPNCNLNWPTINCVYAIDTQNSN